MRKKLLSWVMAIALALGMLIVDLPLSAERVEAADEQYAMWFMDYVYITQVPGGDYSHKGTQNFDVVGYNGDNNIFAPFDCQIVKIHTGEAYGNTVIVESLNSVIYADGSVDKMSMAFAHDNDISDLYVGKIIRQGEVFYQTGNYGWVSGVHSHVTCIRGSYRNDMWTQNEYGNYCSPNAISPVGALFIRDESQIVDAKGLGFAVQDSPAVSHNPSGFLDNVTMIAPGRLYAKGWAYDPDLPSDSITISIYLDGKEVTATTANLESTDVNNAVGISGRHRFEIAFDCATVGTHTVVAYGLNVGDGENAQLNKSPMSVNVTSVPHGETRGFVDTCEYRSDGTIYIDGWGYDKTLDTGYATMRAYVDGVLAYADGDPTPNFYASAPYNNNDGVEKEVGSRNHKYYRPLSVSGLLAGEHTVSVVVVDSATGNEIPCRASDGVNLTVNVPGPVISNVQVADQTSDSYLITCNVSDSAGISKVQFPTWTAENGQDDLPSSWQEGSLSAGASATSTSVNFRVMASDHNNETGQYYTDIYAHNQYGVYTVYKTVSVILEKSISIDEAHFPDAIFRNYLREQFGETLDSEEIANTLELRLPENAGIRDLTGIGYFTELTVLECERNSLTSLDLSANRKLEELICYENRLNMLVLAGEKLQLCNAYGNELTSLDLGTCTRLERLILHDNYLRTLNLSANTELRSIDLLNNPVASLDLSHNTKLEEIWFCDNTKLDLTRYPNLRKISHHVDVREKKLDLTGYFSGLSPSGGDDVKNGTLNGTSIIDISSPDLPVTFHYVDQLHGQGIDIELFIQSYTAGVPTRVSGVSLNQTTASLKVGQTLNLKASIKPEYATNQNVVWSVDKPTVASVVNGVVTGLAVGTARVTVKTEDGNKSAVCTVNVQQGIEGITITGASSVATKKMITLKAEVQPANATNKKVTWSSSDSAVAKVDANGRVTGVSAGIARITATAQDGSGVSAYRDVTVTTAAEQVLIRQGENGVTGQTLGLDPDVTEKSTLALSAELLAKQPDGTYSKTGVLQEVVWKSSAPKVAEVSQDGIVTACTVGTATITATAADGTNKSARVTINVSRLVSTIAISGESQVAAGKTVTLTAISLPDSAKNKTVVWTSSDAAKATVSNGRVTAKKDASGTVTITATAKDGSGTSASYEMTIKKPAEKGIIKQGESDVTGGTIGIDLDDGTPVTLSAVFSAKKTDGSYGTDGVSQSVTWKSSAPKVAVVEADGTVTALSAGKSTITATAGDGSGKNARVTVNVARLVSAITISGENEIALGKSVTLTAAAAPDSAVNKKVTWTSSNKSIADVAASTGRVTGKGIGTAIITATATDGSGVSSSYEVTVKALTDSVIIKKGDDVVSKTILKQDLSDRNTIALSAGCKGKAEGDVVSQRITWKSSKPAAATVAPDGTVTLLSPGKVDITATAADGSGKSAKVTLDVTQSAVTITGADKVATGKSVKLTAQGPKVKWSIVNVTPALSKVTDASVNTSGTLNVKNTVAPGTVITVRATEDAPKKSEEERKTATHVVTVQKNDLKATVCIKQNGENVTGGTIGIDRDTMVPVTLRAEVVDAGGSTEDMSQNVVWKSSAPKVATVDADGTVTPLLAGTTKLTATTTDGTNKSGTVTINVASLAESVTVTAAGNASALAAGKALQFTAAASPKRTAGKKFQWTAVPDYSGIAGFDEATLPKNAVSISTAGRLSVNAKVPVGTVIRVRAEALDGSGSISDPYIVTIKKASGRVEIYQKSDTEYTTNLAGRKVGIDRDTLGTVNLKARVYEEAKTGTTVTNISQEVVWTSSNAKVATVVNGVVTAHAAGTATIKATTADGMNKSASVTINVASMAGRLVLSGSDTIAGGKSASSKYTVAVTPIRTADKSVTWSVAYQLPDGAKTIGASDIRVSNGTLSITKNVPTGTRITLKAVAKDGSGAAAEKLVTVK